MSNNSKSTKLKIGVMTSGGDCPGLNMVLRSIASQAAIYGWELIAIKRAASGLMTRPVDAFVLNNDTFLTGGYISKSGGTFIGGMNKGGPLPNEEREKVDIIVEGYNLLGLDALICIGGDGSLQILNEVAKLGGLNIVGVPKTIDNDLADTDKSIGFDTAVEIATDALDNLQATGSSHDRFMVLEVMGRDAGHIALHSGVAGEADIILIPEVKYSIDGIVAKVKSVLNSGRMSGLVVVSESVKSPEGKAVTKDFADGQERYGGIAEYVANQISLHTGVETRSMSLGHLQRGARPCASDRIIANAFGVKAVQMIKDREFGKMAAWRDGQMVSVCLDDAVSRYKLVSRDNIVFKTAKDLGIYLGDDV